MELQVFKTDIKIEESNFLKSYLNKSQIMLEWGAGWSTLEFSKYVKEYYSIEHNFYWYQRVKSRIESNTKIYYAPPNTRDLKWFPPDKRGDKESFKSYIGFADVLGSLGKRFDVVFIDGRARSFCALKALDFLKEEAVVFIHDFGRPRYWDILRRYSIVDIEGSMAALKTGGFDFENGRYFLIKKYLQNAEFKRQIIFDK